MKPEREAGKVATFRAVPLPLNRDETFCSIGSNVWKRTTR